MKANRVMVLKGPARSGGKGELGKGERDRQGDAQGDAPERLSCLPLLAQQCRGTWALRILPTVHKCCSFPQSRLIHLVSYSVIQVRSVMESEGCTDEMFFS